MGPGLVGAAATGLAMSSVLSEYKLKLGLLDRLLGFLVTTGVQLVKDPRRKIHVGILPSPYSTALQLIARVKLILQFLQNC